MSDFTNPVYADDSDMHSKMAEQTDGLKAPRDMYDNKLDILTQHHTGAQKELIIKAFNYAKKKHKGQKRNSGEIYFSHPVAVALILNEVRADYETICAALLHDVMEDCNVSKDEMVDEFGQTIADLVDGVTKVSNVNSHNREEKDAMTIDKLFVALNDDVRVGFIKLADRIHNMRTIDGHNSYEKKARIAKQTLDIYAPLAALFGLFQFKEELEDRSFKILKSDEYKQIEELRKNYYSSNPTLNQALFSLQYNSPKNPNSLFRLFQQYDEATGEYIDLIPILDVRRVYKSIYGIYKKLSLSYYSDISQIKDLLTYNIITKTEEPSVLYGAMYLVNSKYKLIPVDPIIDYVTHPKNELYRCLITSNLFKTEDGKEETRIRVKYQTPSMYNKATFGLAGFWNYDDMDGVKQMQETLKRLPIYNDMASIIHEYESDTYAFSEFFNKLSQLISPNRIYVTLNDYDFVQTYEGVTLEEFIMRQNDGFIDLNKDYYVNGNLVSVIGDSKKAHKKRSQGFILHNNDSIRTMQKGEVVEKNIFGGISRKRK
ncbi:MAG: HD domain-containing protein [Bacilli bacterium]|nr:HD domain-containing protein [Bacilli bacterium]